MLFSSLHSVSEGLKLAVEQDRSLGIGSMGQLDCPAELRTFIPRLHKKKYRVGVGALRGIDVAFDEFHVTFSQCLAETAGHRFDQVIEFEIVPLKYQGVFDAVANEEIDFLFFNSGVYSCVGVESGAQPLATAISRVEVRGITFDIDVAGGKKMRMVARARLMLSTSGSPIVCQLSFFLGVIFSLASNTEIKDIHDLKDKVIGAGKAVALLGSQMPFYEMEKAGLSYVMDPKKVVFVGGMGDVIDGVMKGVSSMWALSGPMK